MNKSIQGSKKRHPQLIVSNVKRTQASLASDEKVNKTQILKERISKELKDKVETQKNKMAPTKKVEPDLRQNLIRR